MKKRFVGFLILLSLTVGAAGQKPATVKPDQTEQNLRRHIEYLSSDALAGRRSGEAGATTAAGYIANLFSSLRLKPGARSPDGKASYMQPFPIMGAGGERNLIGYNVIGSIEGNDPKLKTEAIVIGAHYDHVGNGDGLAANSKDIYQGANDNASGVAAIIEIARALKKENSNKRTVIFIAFGGNEEGQLGSRFYVNSPVFPIENTIAMIDLDMVGRLNESNLTIGGTGTAGEWKDLITKLNLLVVSASGPAVTSGNDIVDAPTRPVGTRAQFTLQLNEDGYGPSDHSSFYTKKVPVLHFFTGSHLDHHKPSDTADKINYEGEHRIINFVMAIEREIDRNPRRPAYMVARSKSN